MTGVGGAEIPDASFRLTPASRSDKIRGSNGNGARVTPLRSARRGLLVAAGVVGLFAAAELGFTHLYYSRTYNYYKAAEVYWEDQSTLLLYLPHRYLFWTLKPSIRLKAAADADAHGLRPEHSGRQHHEWEIHVGPKGFRGADFPAAKPAGELRVACFGDSRTIGETLGERETYPAQLETLLRDRLPERGVRVLNLGADGWSSHQGLVLLERDALGFSPDVAVFAFGINDTDTDWGVSDLEKARRLDTPLVTVQRALYRSVTFYWAQRQLLWARAKLLGPTRVVRPARDPEGHGTPRLSRVEYGEKLRAFARVCRAHAVEPVLLVIPVNPYQDWEPYTPRIPGAREDAARGELARARSGAPGETLPRLRNLVASEPAFYPARRALASLLREAGELAAAHAEFVAGAELTIFAEYNREARRVAAEERVGVVDATASFREVLPYQALYVDEMHPGPRGATLIAELLADRTGESAQAVGPGR